MAVTLVNLRMLRDEVGASSSLILRTIAVERNIPLQRVGNALLLTRADADAVKTAYRTRHAQFEQTRRSAPAA